MRVTLPPVMHAENGSEPTVREVAGIENQAERLEPLGLTLAEAKQRRTQLQQRLLAQQVAALLATRSRGELCGTPRRTKGQHTRTFRTLVGTVTLPHPRVYHGPCQQSSPTTCRPLTALRTEPTVPELMCVVFSTMVTAIVMASASAPALWSRR